MITKKIHEKGFQLIPMEKQDMTKIGSPGICDSCSDYMLSGTFIGALNSIYCNYCFKEWVEKAVFYDQDIPFETRSTDRILEALNV